MAAQPSAQVPEEAQRRVHGLLSKWHLPPEFLNELIEHRASVSFAKNDFVFLQGSTADVAYWILSGLVKVYCPMPDGTRVLIRVAGPGDFVGVIDAPGASGRRTQAFEAQAMSRVSLAIFTRDHVLTLLKSVGTASLVAFLEDVNTTWSELFFWCAQFLGLSFRERLQSVLEYLGGRFGVRDARGVLLTPELSHDDLAEMIASSRPMVSRLIAEFMERGQLARQGKHYILLRAPQREPVRPLPLAPRVERSVNHNHSSGNLAVVGRQELR